MSNNYNVTITLPTDIKTNNRVPRRTIKKYIKSNGKLALTITICFLIIWNLFYLNDVDISIIDSSVLDDVREMIILFNIL